MPNTEVKPFSADGTWLETTWESRTLPDSMKRKDLPVRVGLSFHIIGKFCFPDYPDQCATLYLVRIFSAARCAGFRQKKSPGRVGRCRIEPTRNPAHIQKISKRDTKRARQQLCLIDIPILHE